MSLAYQWYEGTLSDKYLPNKIVRKAKTAINHQRARCYNENHPYYPYYGAKGIRVKYETREFIGWYIAAIRKWKGSLDDVSVGRIDHKKHYSIDNIELQTRSENSREMMGRNRQKLISRNQKPVVAYDRKTGKVFKTYKSILDAAADTGISVQTVSRHINGKFKRPWGPYIFRSKNA